MVTVFGKVAVRWCPWWECKKAYKYLWEETVQGRTHFVTQLYQELSPMITPQKGPAPMTKTTGRPHLPSLPHQRRKLPMCEYWGWRLKSEHEKEACLAILPDFCVCPHPWPLALPFQERLLLLRATIFFLIQALPWNSLNFFWLPNYFNLKENSQCLNIDQDSANFFWWRAR